MANLCSKCGSPLGEEIEEHCKSKLPPEEARRIELLSRMTLERIRPDDPFKVDIGGMALQIEFTRNFLDKIAHIVSETPPGLEQAIAVCKEYELLQFGINEQLEKLGKREKIKWHKFLPDLTFDGNR